MNNRIGTFSWAAVLLALSMVPAGVEAETTRQQAEKELQRKAPNAGLEACSLITRADVKAATGTPNPPARAAGCATSALAN